MLKVHRAALVFKVLETALDLRNVIFANANMSFLFVL